MKRILILTGLLLLSIFSVRAQNYYETIPEEVPAENKFYFGGDFGAGFSNNTIRFVAAPLVGYRLSPKMSIGGGITYQYFSQEYRPINQPVTRIDSHNYGFRAFGRYRVTSMFFASAEYENLNVELITNGAETFREWVPGFLVGVGAYTPLGMNKALGVSIMYNFLHDDFRSPYANAYVIRFGIVM